jgi:UPF0755 protein
MNDITPPRTPPIPNGSQPVRPPQAKARPGQAADMRRTPSSSPLRSGFVDTTGRPTPPQEDLVTQKPRTESQTAKQALLSPTKPTLLLEKKRPSRLKKVLLWILGIVLFLAALVGAVIWWYFFSLTPYSGGDASRVRIEIASGSSPSTIGQLLEEKKLIRSQHAFDIYTRLSGVRDQLQAGTYNLSPSESTQAIVSHIAAGKVDTFRITFLPGATLAEHRKRLIDAGYAEGEVDAALRKTYDHPLFMDKPPTADLEGYIYGETYTFASDATVEEILLYLFDYYDAVIKKHALVDGFKAHNLTLYQGITLASIIQKEVSGAADQKQVAQVFYSRLAVSMPLGADATFRYAAKKLGVPPAVDLDSPYNTRKYTGLPPGPIASPGLSALQAVASPAPGDFYYFVSGDDGKNYFSRTLEEHEAATQAHCQKNCQL